jgi:hypothetical protein
VEFKVLEDIGNNINDLNDTIENVMTQIRRLGYQWQFDPLDRLEHPEINELEENMSSLLYKGRNTPEKLKELEMDLKEVVKKFYDADYQGVEVNIAPDGSNVFGPNAPKVDTGATIKEAVNTGIVNGENKLKSILEKAVIVSPGLLLTNDFVYEMANNGSTLFRGEDLDNQVKNDIDRQDAFVSEVADVGGLAVGGEGKAVDWLRTPELDYIPSSGVKLRATLDNTTTILGNFDKDTGKIINDLGNVKSINFGPRTDDFNLLNTPNGLYHTPEQFWHEYNKPWLDNVIERKDSVILATKPDNDVLYRTELKTGKLELSGFGREYNYLIDNGYTFDLKTMRMVLKK